MAILTPAQAPTKIIRELDPEIEQVINKNLSEGTREWAIDLEWLHDKALLIETLDAAGWKAKLEQRTCVDNEVNPWWIILAPKKPTVPYDK